MAGMPKIFVKHHQRRGRYNKEYIRASPSDDPLKRPMASDPDAPEVRHENGEGISDAELDRNLLEIEKQKTVQEEQEEAAKKEAEKQEAEKKRAANEAEKQEAQADRDDTKVYKEEGKLKTLRKKIKAHQQETRMTKTEKANLKLKQEQADQLEQTVKAQKRAASGQRAEAKRAKANADQQAAQARIAEEQLKREKLQTREAQLKSVEAQRAQREKLRDQRAELRKKHRAEKKAKKSKSRKSKKSRFAFLTRRGGPRRKMTPQGRAYLSRKIKQNRREGMPQKQAVAVGFEQTRDAGYYVPPRRQ